MQRPRAPPAAVVVRRKSRRVVGIKETGGESNKVFMSESSVNHERGGPFNARLVPRESASMTSGTIETNFTDERAALCQLFFHPFDPLNPYYIVRVARLGAWLPGASP